MTLNEVLKNTNYDVSLFSEEARKYVEDAIVVKTIRGKESLFIKCLKRDSPSAHAPGDTGARRPSALCYRLWPTAHRPGLCPGPNGFECR